MPYKLKDPYRHKFNQSQYHLSNWPEYNLALKSRGNINIWFTQDIIEGWYHKLGQKKTHGRQKIYSDLAINTMRLLGTIFNQRLRQTEGFVESIIKLMNLSLMVPDYSTLSRRAATMHIPHLSSMLEESSEPIDIAIDSTGLKVYGAGEWFINKHGNKHRSWQKLHLTIDLDSQKIIAVELTKQDVGDSSVVADLLPQINHKINKMVGDKAYDNFWTYEALKQHNIKSAIPPQSTAILSENYKEKLTQRDNTLLDRCELGIDKWQKNSSYNKRSLVEVAISRYKKIIGNKLHAKLNGNRVSEIKLGCYVLNKMLDLGKPNSFKVKKSA